MSENSTIQHAHWHYLFEDLQYSSEEFYKALKELIKSYSYPDVEASVVTYSEGRLLSAKRSYLRVRRNNYQFDICAAPFGKSFFISWWLSESSSFVILLLAKIPLVGKWLTKQAMMKTFYQIDTETMFQESIHAIILNVIDSVTTVKGMRSLADNERKLLQSN